MLSPLRHPGFADQSACGGSVPEQRRLPGTGSPSQLFLVAQVFNLCVFSVRIIPRL
jgi:hypothetical protein